MSKWNFKKKELDNYCNIIKQNIPLLKIFNKRNSKRVDY